METTEIYTAQLNVSNYFTVETVNNLIDILKPLGRDAYYNHETRSVDLLLEHGEFIADFKIRECLKTWVKTLPADLKDINTYCNNIEFIFNITKIMIDNEAIIKIYLY